jgi:hypothetical protein
MTTVITNTNEDLAIPYSNKKQILSTYEIAMTTVVANTNEDLAIPYSNKNNIIYI